MNWLWTIMSKLPPMPEHNRTGPYFFVLALLAFLFAGILAYTGDWGQAIVLLASGAWAIVSLWVPDRKP